MLVGCYLSLFFCSSSSSSSGSTMVLQAAAAAAAAISSSLHFPPLFSSKSFYPQTQLGFYQPVAIRTNGNRNISITCTSTSQDHKTLDLEAKPAFQWKDLLSLGSATVLSQWEEEGRKLTHEELQLCVKAMKKYRKYQLALEVYEWMNDQGDRFRLSSSDRALQLDLISKVHGISNAEEYFLNLPESSKDNLLYGALLNAYVQAEMREKAESLFEEIRDRGYATCSLPFNSMMTLYTKLKEYEKLMVLIVEMLEKDVKLDISSYNIWITTCGELGSTEKLEQAVEWMKLDSTFNPNWSTYNTLASVYIKLDQTEKAKVCLKEVENRITGSERMPYIYLLTLYSTLGEKEDVYRIWNTYKSNFPDSLSLGYKAMVAALLVLNDSEGAEKILEESNNPKLRSLLFHQSMTKSLYGKANDLLDLHVDGANSTTWESLALSYIAKKQIPMALTCLTKATTAEGADNWEPNPRTVSAFNLVCDQESDLMSKDLLLKVLGGK